MTKEARTSIHYHIRKLVPQNCYVIEKWRSRVCAAVDRVGIISKDKKIEAAPSHAPDDDSQLAFTVSWTVFFSWHTVLSPIGDR